jgi:hypothetical protein
MRNLVKKYIKDNYIINIVIQKILKLIKDYNKNNKHTFNMLTKPDLVLKQSV